MAEFALAAITKLGGVARCVHLPEMRFGVGVKCAQQSEFGLHRVAKFAR